MIRVGAADRSVQGRIGDYVATHQRDPSHHVAFVGERAEQIVEELAQVDGWAERILVAMDEDVLAGVLVPDIDLERRRVWWIGPWANSRGIAMELLDEARVEFGELFDEEEMAPDSRNSMVRAVAARRGFVEGTWSWVLTRAGSEPSAGEPASLPLSTGIAPAVAELHDRLFPETHTSGERLVASERTRIRYVLTEGELAGYIAFEIQPDGTGYIDFLGIEPDFRRRGLGRALVLDACRELGARGARVVNLTVRADAPGAFQLYRSAGFTEERRIVPCRRGFTLG